MRRIFKYVIVDNLALHPDASCISPKNNLLKKYRKESVVDWGHPRKVLNEIVLQIEVYKNFTKGALKSHPAMNLEGSSRGKNSDDFEIATWIEGQGV